MPRRVHTRAFAAWQTIKGNVLMKKIIITALSAALIAGCAKVQTTGPVSPSAMPPQRFEACMDPCTKVSFDGHHRAWEEDDVIRISDGSTEALFGLSACEDGVATFVPLEGQPALNMSSAGFTAVYPADIMQEGIKSCAIAAPGDETARIPMAAVSRNAKLVFRNLCALLKVSVSTDADNILLSELGVSSSTPLAGRFSIVDGAAVIGEGGSYSIALQSEDGVPIGNEPTDLYLSVPAGEYSDFTITLRTTGGVVKVYPLTAGPLTLERNRIYTRTITANGLDICDFREEWNANCYIATAKGKYRFAAVRPDGSPVGDIASVGVYWSYDNSSTAPEAESIISKVRYADGVVDFEATDKQGSALIAAYDADGRVLWSWHIWRTDERPQDVTTASGAVMDRYLGALSATPGDLHSVGLMYQYGRKDPFPGRVGNGNIQGKFQGNAYREEAGPVEIVTAVQNPSVRYYGTDSNFWATAQDRELADWDGDRKTIYDPCPYGYRVPVNTVYGATDKASFARLFAWDATNVGASFENGRAWYPATGQLAPKGVNMNSGTAISFSWSRNKNANGNPYLLDLRSNTINGFGGGSAAASGFAVRCQRVTENQ